ncbi:TPA: hypothetical protein ACUAG1_004551, partial [Escherichia coli]
MVREGPLFPLSGTQGVPDGRVSKKVVWLAIQAASQKWTMPLRDGRMAMSRFILKCKMASES